MVERLEARTVPSTFIWTDASANHNGLWEDTANWTGGGAGAYPGWNGAATTNDVASFRPLVNDNVTMQNAHQIATLDVSNPDMGNIVLQAPLIINNGGTLAGGTIIQRTAGGANGPIFISGGTFDWTGGNINYSPNIATAASTFTIGGAATVNFAPVQQGGLPSNFGDDLVIQQPGLLYLSNAAPANSIILRNRPTITNAGTISARVDNGSGLSIPDGDPAITIQNTGIIDKSAGTGEYRISSPINNNGGNISVFTGRFYVAGTDPTTGYSVMNQGTGTINIYGGTQLGVTSGLSQTAGTTSAPNGGTATIGGRLAVSGGTVSLGNVGTRLVIGGTFQFSAGTVQISAQNGGQGVNGMIVADGNITITTPTTTVAVTFVGPGAQPTPIDVMRSQTGTISAIAGTNPNGYTATLAQTLRANDTYRLTRQGGGGGAPQGSSIADNGGGSFLDDLALVDAGSVDSLFALAGNGLLDWDAGLVA